MSTALVPYTAVQPARRIVAMVPVRAAIEYWRAVMDEYCRIVVDDYCCAWDSRQQAVETATAQMDARRAQEAEWDAARWRAEGWTDAQIAEAARWRRG